MRWLLALALFAASAAGARDFSVIALTAAGSVDYAAIAKGYDAALVSRLSRLGHRVPAAASAPLSERPILARLTVDDDPEFMKLANSLPTTACHPKASRGKRSPRSLGISATDTSPKIGAACYHRF
jgi:hypothetical protein